MKFFRLPLDDTPFNRRFKMPGPMEDVHFLTVHNTDEPFSAFQERDRVNFRSAPVSVSFHYAVDETGVVELIPPSVRAWHAGDGAQGEGNLHSIGIEICRSICTGPEEFLYREAERNAVMLCALLLRRFRLGAGALRMHRDWSGKNCPHRIIAEHSWSRFVEAVRTCPAVTLEDTAPPPETERMVLHLRGPSGCFWQDSHHAPVRSPGQLIRLLRQDGISRVRISSRIRERKLAEYRELFERNGIRVMGFCQPEKVKI